MSDLDKLNLARKDLAQVLDLHDTAVQRLRDQQRGQPGSGLGGGGSRGSSSPVETALGIGGPGEDGGIRGDSAAHKLAVVDRLRHNICRDLRILALMLAAEAPKAPSGKQRREVERANTPDDGCQHHAAAGLYEQAEHTGTVSDTLTLPMALCGFCYWQVRRKGVLPRGEVLVQRQVTGKDPKERVS